MTRFSIVLLLASGCVLPANAADYSCNNLVPAGSRMICPGFEPNWAVELICEEPVMSSNYINAFSGDEITETPGNASVTSQDPWSFSTSHGIEGTIAFTPGQCQDESDRFFDFTLTTTAQPDFPGSIPDICCRIESNR
ncbi:hypothetical protein [Pararhizobium haloflavum]|uniref:hypothetical protein n=1 Tax=Pararhizobium haloflavum TaxID=2037914 RepID=UPI000C19A636|nr:hypothetical protein [Pararhizobium haloflavum]